VYKNIPNYTPDEIKMEENFVAVGLRKVIEDGISFKNDMEIPDQRMIAVYDLERQSSGSLPYTIIRQKDLL